MTGVACVVANIETRAWIRVLFGHASLPIVCESKCSNIVWSIGNVGETCTPIIGERSNNDKFYHLFETLLRSREKFSRQ